jgi:hypothetical protein
MAETASLSVASFGPPNFAFEELKVKMNQFTLGFDKWTQRQRQQILRDRNEFAKIVAEARGMTVTILQSNE